MTDTSPETVERYDIDIGYYGASESSDGDWVAYEDLTDTYSALAGEDQ